MTPRARAEKVFKKLPPFVGEDAIHLIEDEIADAERDVLNVAAGLRNALRLLKPGRSWRGWENGNGEEIGSAIERLIRAYDRVVRARGAR